MLLGIGGNREGIAPSIKLPKRRDARARIISEPRLAAMGFWRISGWPALSPVWLRL